MHHWLEPLHWYAISSIESATVDATNTLPDRWCAHRYDMLNYVCLRQNSEKLLIVALSYSLDCLLGFIFSVVLVSTFSRTRFHLQKTRSSFYSQATGDGPLTFPSIRS